MQDVANTTSMLEQELQGSEVSWKNIGKICDLDEYTYLTAIFNAEFLQKFLHDK